MNSDFGKVETAMQGLLQDSGFKGFQQIVRLYVETNRPAILKQAQELMPEADIVDVKLGGSFARGEATESSDIDLEVHFKGDVTEEDLWHTLADRIPVGVLNSGLFDVIQVRVP